MIKIVLIGAGHLAFHFQEQFSRCKEVVLEQWYSRSIEKIKFAEKTVDITDQIPKLKAADLYLICVSDSAIPEISNKINVTGLVVHCAGSVPMEVLSNHPRHGVFYPLQTFTKTRELRFDRLPFCLESAIETDFELLEKLALLLGGTPHKVDSEKRVLIHLTAVVINNFGNHLLQLGSELSEHNNIPFDIFGPLIKETYEKAVAMGPQHTQTGPAKRNDQQTLDKHLSMLESHDLKKLYLDLTTSIQKRNEQKQL